MNTLRMWSKRRRRMCGVGPPSQPLSIRARGEFVELQPRAIRTVGADMWVPWKSSRHRAVHPLAVLRGTQSGTATHPILEPVHFVGGGISRSGPHMLVPAPPGCLFPHCTQWPWSHLRITNATTNDRCCRTGGPSQASVYHCLQATKRGPHPLGLNLRIPLPVLTERSRLHCSV